MRCVIAWSTRSLLIAGCWLLPLAMSILIGLVGRVTIARRCPRQITTGLAGPYAFRFCRTSQRRRTLQHTSRRHARYHARIAAGMLLYLEAVPPPLMALREELDTLALAITCHLVAIGKRAPRPRLLLSPGEPLPRQAGLCGFLLDCAKTHAPGEAIWLVGSAWMEMGRGRIEIREGDVRVASIEGDRIHVALSWNGIRVDGVWPGRPELREWLSKHEPFGIRVVRPDFLRHTSCGQLADVVGDPKAHDA